jgi:hypothetical protein
VSGRTDLAEHLATVLPVGWSVIDHDANPTIATTTVMTYVQRVEAGVTPVFRLYTVTALVMTPKQTGHDTDLEAALEEVLEAIDLWDYPANWRTAEYVTYADTYPAYRVTVELHTRRHYPGDPEPEPEAEPEPDPDFQEE